MTEVEATRLIEFLIDGFPGVRMSSGSEQVYINAMTQMNASEVQTAIEHLIYENKKFPMIADIKEMINTNRREIERSKSASSRNHKIDNTLPPPEMWVAPLTRMLEQASRYRRMNESWCARAGAVAQPDPGQRFVDLAQDAAVGCDITERFRRVVMRKDGI